MVTLTPMDRARLYLEKIPGAVSGQGGHNQTFAAARALVHGFALNESDALDLLTRDYNPRCFPPWSERELIHKVQSAAAAQHQKPRGHLLGDDHRPAPAMQPPVPPISPQRQRIDPASAVENYLRGFRCTADDLRAASPCKLPPIIRPGGEHWHRQGAYLIAQLFEEHEFANIVTESITKDGKASPVGSGVTLDQNEWQGILLAERPPTPGGAWLRMNPCAAVGSGKGGAITDRDVTAFRFALVEIDTVPIDLQIGLFARLALPISAIIHSGGKSIHAWIRLDANNADEYRAAVSALLVLLARFGVDGKNKNPSRLSRLPGVTRTIGMTDDGMQDLLFLNPHPQQKGIM